MKTLKALLLLTLSLSTLSALACESMQTLNDCDTPEEAIKVLRAKDQDQLINIMTPENINRRMHLFDYPSETLTKTSWFPAESNGDFDYLIATLHADNPMYEADKQHTRFNNWKLTVQIHYFRSKVGEGKRPLIIAFPTILNMGTAERMFAEDMAEKGFHVIVAKVEFLPDPTLPLLELEKLQRRTMMKGKMVIDAATKFMANEIDITKIGSWGLSLGANRAATLIGIDQRVKAIAIISGGGNNADMLTYSVQEFVEKFRARKMKEFGMTDRRQFFSFIRANSNVDPIYFAHNVHPDNVFMIMPKEDFKIPSRNQLELWDAFGRPGPVDQNWVGGDHLSPIYWYLLSPIHHGRIVDFFRDRFDIED